MIIFVAFLAAITALNTYLLIELYVFRKHQLKLNEKIIEGLRVLGEMAQLEKEMTHITELKKQLEKKECGGS